LTRAEGTTREHVFKLAEFLRWRLAGFEQARIEYTATQVGVRATRQIIGESMPSMEEVKEGKFADTVAKPYLQQEMRLPYGSILPQKIDNLLVAGRCISAAEEAMGKLRLIPVCSATGEAAGTAAALSLGQKFPPRNLNRTFLQKTLRKKGVDLGLE
jgi:hypothetical protein